MLRVVLAAVLTVALVGAAAPAVEDARIDRTATTVEADVAGFESTAQALRRNAPAGRQGQPTARRVVSIRLPAGRTGGAAVEAFAVGGPLVSEAPGDDRTRDLVAYRIRGGEARRIWLEGVDLRVGPPGDLASDATPLRFGRPGRLELRLRPVAIDSRVVIGVRAVVR